MLDITPIEQTTKNTPKIIVIGSGGAGGNAVNNMIVEKLDGCDFAVCNTDAQALEYSKAENKFQIGKEITSGLGAGARPEVGRQAAEENFDEISKFIDGANMVFISAGMGGGTGTGSAPVIARAAREKGILTVGIVTKPFEFEGTVRMRQAQEGISELQKYVDTLIVIPNEKLHTEVSENDTLEDAFKKVDRVLLLAVQGVTDLMIKPGKINLDFNDIRTVMEKKGKAMMGVGEASKSELGSEAASFAAETAIRNRLLDDDNMKGAKSAIINITSSSDISLHDITVAVNRLRQEIDPEANIIYGQTIDNDIGDTIRISIVATGINDVKNKITSPFKVSDTNEEQLWEDDDIKSDDFLIEKQEQEILATETNDEINNESIFPDNMDIDELNILEEQFTENSELFQEKEKFEETITEEKEGYDISIDPFIEADMANATRDKETVNNEQKIKSEPEKKGFFNKLFSGFVSNKKAVEKTDPIVDNNYSKTSENGNLAMEQNKQEESEIDIPPFLRKQLN